MKKILYLMIGLMVAACAGERGERETLRRAEALLDGSPDEALAVLDRAADSTAAYSRADRMRYLLLRTQALYQESKPLDTITYMDDVLAYYRHHGNRKDRTQALYMMASIYRDRHNSPMALQYFREAVAEADTTRADCDFLLVSRLYGQMADLFHSQQYPQQEIAMTLQAVHFAQLAKDTMEMLHHSFRIAAAYFLLNREDSVAQITQLAYETYRALGRRDLAVGKLPFVIHYHLLHHRYTAAKALLDEYRVHSGFFDAHGEIAPGKEQYYNQLGYYYQGVSRLDSALWCYHKLLTYTTNMVALENGYRGLMLTYRQLHQPDSVAKYAILYTNLNDSAVMHNAMRELSRTQALYDYSENQRIAEEKTRESRRLWTALYWGAAVMVLLVALSYRYMARQRAKTIEQARTMNKKYLDTLLRCERASRELAVAKRDIRRYKDEKEQEVNRLQQQLHEEFVHVEQWDMEQALLRHDIVQQLHRHANRAAMPADSEWEDLDGLVQRVFPHFYETLRQPDLQLTEKEIRLCILTRLNFIPTEVATLLGLTKQRVSNMRSQINDRLFHERGARNLDQHLRRL